MSIGYGHRDILLQQVVSIVEAFRGASRASRGDFARVEQAAGVAVRSMRRVLMTAGLADSVGSSARSYACSECGRSLLRYSRRKRRVVTSEGEAELVWTRWRCRWCSRDYYPVESANGLRGSQFTTGAKGVIAGLGAELPYARVSALLSERGVSVSAKEVDRTVEEVSAWRDAEECQAVRATFPSRRKVNGCWEAVRERAEAVALHEWSGWRRETTATISVDGAKVRSPQPGPEGLEWFECRVGLIAPVEEGAKGASFYIGGVLEPDELFRRLLAGWRSDPVSGRRSLFVSDGAEWIWGRASILFPRSRQVLDIYHAAEHVATAACAGWGEGSQQARLWRRRAREMLLAPGGPAEVLKLLRRQLENGAPVDRKTLEREVQYLHTHRHRMPYAELHTQGLPVGSGAMESAIKQTSTQRLRQPGMMWSRAGADRMLRLRAALLGGNLKLTIARKHDALRTLALNSVRPAPA